MLDALSAANTTGATQDSQATLSENFDLFLSLLTEQLRNQDPLDPTDTAEFTNQLVQFSSVEQQILQNDQLETLIGLQSVDAANTAMALVGQDVAFEGGVATLDADGARWRIDAGPTAAVVGIAILDESGAVVRQDTVAAAQGPQEYVWDGVDAEGVPAPDGLYTLRATAVTGDDEETLVTLAGYAPVEAVDFSGEVPTLIAGGLVRDLGDVVVARAAATPPATPPATP